MSKENVAHYVNLNFSLGKKIKKCLFFIKLKKMNLINKNIIKKFTQRIVIQICKFIKHDKKIDAKKYGKRGRERPFGHQATYLLFTSFTLIYIKHLLLLKTCKKIEYIKVKTINCIKLN